jgi:hypothetical protein
VQTANITGSGITIQDMDVLVFEAWYITPGQANTTSRTITWSINNIGGTPDPYAYIETPQDLLFSGVSPSTGTGTAQDGTNLWIGCAY